MADVAAMRTAAETGLSALFDRLKGGLPGDVSVREAALAGFGTRGLPHRRVEEFKYFDLRALMREAAPPAERPGPAELAAASRSPGAFAAIDAVRLTFVNGHFAPELSGVDATTGLGAVWPACGIEVVPLNDAMRDGHVLLAGLGGVAIARDNPLVQLNTAFLADGALIRIPAGLAVDRPIALRFVSTGAVAFSTAVRILVSVEEGASVELIESHEGPDGLASQPSTVLEMSVGDRAQVRHMRLNAESPQALALSTLAATLGAGVSFASLNAVLGSAAARHQVFVSFAGEGSHAQLDGVSLLKDRQHADSTLVVDHAVPHCTSREVFKSILDDQATGVFQGKIIVRPKAQKTDGAMRSDALLLTDTCAMNNKPELEIFADDVVCGHGATCGALNAELLFYLESRGLPQADAESLLLQAFVGPPLDSLPNEAVREVLIGRVEAWLAARR